MAYRANLFEFGAVAGDAGGANAATNDAALVAAIASPTKIIEVDPEIFEVSQTIHINQNAKHLIGVDGNDVFGATNEGTRIRWHGESGGTMVRMQAAADGVDLIAPEFSGFFLDGREIAGRGFEARACRRPKANNLHIRNIRGETGDIGFYLSCGPVKNEENINALYRGEFTNLSVNVTGDAYAIVLTGEPGKGHVAFTEFRNPHVVHENGVAFYLRHADDCHFFNASASRKLGGTGITVMFDGLADYVVGNAFWGLQCGAHPVGAVTKVYSRGSKARQNCIYGLMGVDNQPQVMIDASSELYYDYLGGGYTPTLLAEKAVRRMPKRVERSY